jgi:hypothetical protein
MYCRYFAATTEYLCHSCAGELYIREYFDVLPSLMMCFQCSYAVTRPAISPKDSIVQWGWDKLAHVIQNSPSFARQAQFPAIGGLRPSFADLPLEANEHVTGRKDRT